MVPVGDASLAKEFFYWQPKQEGFDKKSTLSPGVEYFLALFAPVDRARVKRDNLHYFIGVFL